MIVRLCGYPIVTKTIRKSPTSLMKVVGLLLCTMDYALWTMPYALCTVNYALCPMHYTLCLMHYVLKKNSFSLDVISVS